MAGTTCIALTLKFPHVFFKGLLQNCEKRLLASSCVSVYPSTEKTWLPLNRILWNLVFEYFLANLSREFRFH